MENMTKGWQHISAIFQKILESVEKDSLIEPQFIFRGITRRYFSSSKSIPKYLELHPNFVTNHKISAEEQNKEAYKIFYDKYIQFYKSIKGRSSQEILNALMDCDEYNFVAPEYVKSGAAIRMQNLKNRSHIDYINYIKHLINDAKCKFPEYIGEYSDIEILADIQHKGGASCLVDFSNNFLISLWFATQTNKDDKDFGYLFCYDVNVEMLEKDNLSALSHNRSKENIESLLYATTKSARYTEDKSYRFWLWKPSFLNERIARQDSIFVFGLEPFYIKEHGIIVIPIPFEWKKDIQLVLKSYFGISEESIYCDNNGFATSHDKNKPYERVMSSFFNEYFSPISKNKNLIFCNLQNGMTCLFEGEYDLALQYFMSFESSTKDITRQKLEKGLRRTSIDESTQDIKMFIIDIELHFSKSLCLKHLACKHRAIEEYIITKERCISLLSKISDASKFWNDNAHKTTKIKRYQKYVYTKYQKTIKDLMDLFYDTKQYEEALGLVDSIQNIIPNKSTSLIETIKNEINTLNELTNHINKSEASINHDIIVSQMAGNIQPFCYVLNQYFIFVLKSVKKQRIDKDSLDKLLKRIENQNKVDFSQKHFFTRWDFSDIVSTLKVYELHNPVLYNGIIAITAQVEDFMAYINSKSRIHPY